MSTFHNMDELTRCLDREKKLLNELFAKRNTLSFRYDYALELTDYRAERIKYLIENEVVRESGDFLEMEDIYKENIGYWMSSSSEKDKYKYSDEVRRALKRIALATEKNVIDVKRNIDRTYKNEPGYKIKKKKLEDLDVKRKGISSLIDRAESVIDEENAFLP